MYRIGIYILAGFAVLLGLTVGILNSEQTTLDLLWVEFEWPLGLIMVASFVVGLLTGLAALWLARVLPLRMQLRSLRKQAASSNPSSAANPAPPELPKS